MQCALVWTFVSSFLHFIFLFHQCYYVFYQLVRIHDLPSLLIERELYWFDYMIYLTKFAFRTIPLVLSILKAHERLGTQNGELLTSKPATSY